MLRHGTLMLMVCVLWCLGATSRPSDLAPKGDTVDVTGIVRPAASTAQEVATVQADKVLYRIVNDAKGKIVARDAGGKKAEIRGIVADRDGVKWITVTWCALVE